MPPRELPDGYAEATFSIDAITAKAEEEKSKAERLVARLNADPNFTTRMATAIDVSSADPDNKADRLKEIDELLVLLNGPAAGAAPVAGAMYYKPEADKIINDPAGGQSITSVDAEFTGLDLNTMITGGMLPTELATIQKAKKDGRANLLQARTILDAIDQKARELQAARTQIEKVEDKKAVRAGAVKKQLDDFYKDDLKAINEKADRKGFGKLIQKFNRSTLPRVFAGAAAGLLSLVPGGRWLGLAGKGILSIAGGATAGNAAATALEERSALKAFEGMKKTDAEDEASLMGVTDPKDRDHYAKNAVMDFMREKDPNSVAELIKSYLEGASGAGLTERLNEVMSAYAKFRGIATVKGLKVDSALAAIEDQTLASSGAMNRGAMRKFLNSGPAWQRIAKSVLVGGAATGIGILGAATGLGAVGILGGAALNGWAALAKSRPRTATHDHYEFSAFIEGVQKGVTDFAKKHPDKEKELMAVNNSGFMEGVSNEMAERRKKFTMGGAAVFAVGTAFFGWRDLAGHSNPEEHVTAATGAKEALPAAAATTAGAPAAPDPTHLATPTGAPPVTPPVPGAPAMPPPIGTPAAPLSGIHFSAHAEAPGTTLHLDDVATQHKELNAITADLQKTGLYKNDDDLAHAVVQKYADNHTAVTDGLHVNAEQQHEILKEVKETWANTHGHTLNPDALLHNEGAGADDRLMTEIFKGYTAKTGKTLTPAEMSDLRLRLETSWEAKGIFSDKITDSGALTGDPAARAELIFAGKAHGIDPIKEIEQGLYDAKHSTIKSLLTPPPAGGPPPPPPPPEHTTLLHEHATKDAEDIAHVRGVLATHETSDDDHITTAINHGLPVGESPEGKINAHILNATLETPPVRGSAPHLTVVDGGLAANTSHTIDHTAVHNTLHAFHAEDEQFGGVVDKIDSKIETFASNTSSPEQLQQLRMGVEKMPEGAFGRFFYGLTNHGQALQKSGLEEVLANNQEAQPLILKRIDAILSSMPAETIDQKAA